MHTHLEHIAHDDDDEEGFTLIELLVVVLILGILLVIAVPAFLRAQDGAKDKAAESNIRAALSATKSLYAEAQTYDTTSTKFGPTPLAAAEPALRWVDATAGSSKPEEVAVQGTPTEVVLSVKSSAGDCFYVKDNVDTSGATTGTSYARVNDVAGACTPDPTLTAPTHDFAPSPTTGWAK